MRRDENYGNNIKLYFLVLTGVIIIFQLCLAAGLPWGSASMGGKFPGKYPAKMRLVALINAIILVFFIVIVLARSGLSFKIFSSLSRVLIWIVVVFSFLSTVMNSISPSKIEKIWVPVSLFQFISSLIIAI